MIIPYDARIAERVAAEFGFSCRVLDRSIEIGFFTITEGVPGSTFLVEQKETNEPRIAARCFRDALRIACIRNAHSRFDIALGKAAERYPVPDIPSWDPDEWLAHQLFFREFALWYSRQSPGDLAAQGFITAHIHAFRKNPLEFLTVLDEDILNLLQYDNTLLPEDQLLHFRDFVAWFLDLTSLMLRQMDFDRKQIRDYLMNPFAFYLALDEDDLGKFRYRWSF